MKPRRALALSAVLAMLCAPAMAEDRTIVVPNVTIYPGDLIGDSQVVERTFNANSTGKYPVIEFREQIVGKVARRTLLPGKPIPANGVRETDVISRGGTVLAIYRAGGLTITSLVSPLKAGSTGDIIEARNIDSGKIIRGLVQADGTLRIGLAR